MSEQAPTKEQIEHSVKIQEYVDQIMDKAREVENALRKTSKEAQIRIFLNTVVYPISSRDFVIKTYTEKNLVDKLVEVLKLKEDLAVYVKQNNLNTKE